MNASGRAAGPRTAIASRIRSVALWGAGLGLAFVALMGVAHTKPGRPLLALLFGAPGAGAAGRAGGCPLGFDQGGGDPARREAGRLRRAEGLRGEGKASGRPALGFALDATTRAEIEAWAAKAGVSCVEPAAPLFGADLDCSNVASGRLHRDASALDARSLWFQFDEAGLLVGVRAARYTPDPGAAAAALGAGVERLGREAGAPARRRGEPSAEYLAAGLLRQARVEFAFQDYFAAATATKLGQNEYVVVDEYRSLAGRSPAGGSLARRAARGGGSFARRAARGGGSRGGRVTARAGAAGRHGGQARRAGAAGEAALGPRG